jgi:hypothetical protein
MSRRYNSDNEEEDSFEKEYLNIFKNDFLQFTIINPNKIIK